MIRHVIFMKFKEGTDSKKVGAALEAVRELQRKTVELIGWQVVADVGHRDTSYPYALIADFENLDAVNRYQAGPEHIKLGAEIGPVLESIAAIDYEV
jgi:hypothetical protein